MPISDEQILRQNGWWANAKWRRDDPHLRDLDRQPIILGVDPLADLPLTTAAVHVVRGPRQVGKSTALKRLASRALEATHEPRRVIYLAADLIEDEPPSALYSSLVRAKELAGLEGRCLFLLDEVTLVTRWQNALKSLWDDGVIRDDVVVCTGSSAIELRGGSAERLPGRRGAGDDILLLPQSFGSVACGFDSTIPAPPQLDLAALVTPEGRSLLSDMQRHLPALQVALERYLRFGGLPAATAEMIAGAPEPSRHTRRIVHDSLVKELGRRGASTAAAHALLESVVRSLGSKTNWATLAREMDIKLGPRRRPSSRVDPDPATLRAYLELLADGYFLLILYFWRKDSHSNALSNDKKLYFIDPLLHQVASEHAPGLADDASARVENALAVHLLRRYEPREMYFESPAEPQRLHAWARPAGEIDFIAGSWPDRAALEVKYGYVKLGVAANVAKAHPARPALVASKDTLVLDRDPYVIAPAALLLWALGT